MALLGGRGVRDGAHTGITASILPAPPGLGSTLGNPGVQRGVDVIGKGQCGPFPPSQGEKGAPEPHGA